MVVDIQLVCTVIEGEVITCEEYTQLRRLLVLLIDNALKYTEAGTVSVTLAVRDSQILLEVSDTGIGIESSALPMLFNRFGGQTRFDSDSTAGLGWALPWRRKSPPNTKQPSP